jgi:rhomboid family GlyGly-CTERM serine protease
LADGRGLARPGGLWVLVAAALGAGSLLGAAMPGAWPDWQPARFAAEPWRAFSAALAHGSGAHLAANLAATALVAAYGWAAGATRRLALAWLVAWPLTQTGLLLRPALAHYVGLSGVLHAGVAAVTVQLLWCGDRRQRTVGGAVAVGLLAKLALEQPWGPLLHPPGALGVAVAPLAHATGTLAGAACAALALAGARRGSA